MGRKSMTGRQADQYSDSQWQTVADDYNLTPRELEVVQVLLDKQNAVAVAHALAVSPSTVYSHLASIYAKLGVTNRMALTMRIVDALVAAAKKWPQVIPPHPK